MAGLQQTWREERAARVGDLSKRQANESLIGPGEEFEFHFKSEWKSFDS